MHLQRPGWGVAVCGSCSFVGLRWWAGVYCACVPLVISCSSECLHMPNHHVFLQIPAPPKKFDALNVLQPAKEHQSNKSGQPQGHKQRNKLNRTLMPLFVSQPKSSSNRQGRKVQGPRRKCNTKTRRALHSGTNYNPKCTSVSSSMIDNYSASVFIGYLCPGDT